MHPHLYYSHLQVQLVTEGDIVSELYMLIEGEVELIPGTGVEEWLCPHMFTPCSQECASPLMKQVSPPTIRAWAATTPFFAEEGTVPAGAAAVESSGTRTLVSGEGTAEEGARGGMEAVIPSTEAVAVAAAAAAGTAACPAVRRLPGKPSWGGAGRARPQRTAPERKSAKASPPQHLVGITQRWGTVSPLFWLISVALEAEGAGGVIW